MISETTVRLSVFLGVFAIMAMWEAARPRRARALSRPRRWTTNLGIVVIDTIVARLLFPVAAVGAALDAEARGWGLFNLIDLPPLIEIIAAFVLFDLAIWTQHVVFHHVPLLWRFHMVHHADEEMDVSTGLRFHPVEIAMSMAIKIALVYLLGPAALAVIIFEVVLNAAAMWSHSNLRLPAPVDNIVRKIIVTPDMHTSHHSTDRREHDTNFGFFFSFWDRMFGVYTDTPAAGHDGVEIGLPPWRKGQSSRLVWALLAPFRRSS